MGGPARYEARDGVVFVALKVVPGSSRSRIVGVLGDRLKVAVAAAPERGAANDEVCRLLAQRLGLKRADVRIVAGSTHPLKIASVPRANIEHVRRLLEDDPAP